MQNAPLPDNFGWIKDEIVWKPVWTHLPVAAKANSENCRYVAAEQDHIVPGNPAVK